MATTDIFIGIGGAPDAVSDIGPGGSGGAGAAGIGSVLGQTVTIQTSTNASATFELRMRVNTPGSGENVNTELGSQNVWTAEMAYLALKHLSWIVRQRGFILGSGGPGTVAGTSGGAQPQTIPLPI